MKIKNTLLGVSAAIIVWSASTQAASQKLSTSSVSKIPDASMAAYDSDRYVWEKMVRSFQVSTASAINLDWELWSTTKFAYKDSCGPAKWPTEDLLDSSGVFQNPKAANIVNNTPHNFSTTQFAILTLNFSNPYYEELRINRPMFDYIQEQGLYDQNKVYELAKNGEISFPKEAMMIKAQWTPMDTVDDEYKDAYYTKTIDAGYIYKGAVEDKIESALDEQDDSGSNNPTTGPTLMGLVGFHLVTHELPNWVWSTFEFSGNPGMCDFTGCTDSFGAVPHYIPANEKINKGYNSETSPALESLFQEFEIPKQFLNYRLKGSQTQYTDAMGKPTLLGNSILEANLVKTSSCITCHARATLNSAREKLSMFTPKSGDGLTNFRLESDTTTLGFHPITYMGSPNYNDFLSSDSSVKTGEEIAYYQTNFMWQLAQHAKPCDETSDDKASAD